MSKWFYKLMGEVIGPITTEELLRDVADGAVFEDTEVRKNDDGEWKPAASVKNLFDKADEFQNAEIENRKQKRAEHERKKKLRKKNLTVSTSGAPPHWKWEIIDTIFVACSDGRGGLNSQNGSIENAWHNACHILKNEAYKLGADKVINTQFEYRFATIGNNAAQAAEIFAYGTAIRFIEE